MISRIISQLEKISRTSKIIIKLGTLTSTILMTIGFYYIITNPLIALGNDIVRRSIDVFSASILIALVLDVAFHKKQ